MSNNTNIDVVVVNQQGKDMNTDIDPNATLASNETASIAPKNGMINYVFGNPSTNDSSCGKMRKMFVTITNIAPPATSSRLL